MYNVYYKVSKCENKYISFMDILCYNKYWCTVPLKKRNIIELEMKVEKMVC